MSKTALSADSTQADVRRNVLDGLREVLQGGMVSQTKLSHARDKAFFRDLFVGTLKTWFFFSRVSQQWAKSPIKEKSWLSCLFHLSAYQLCFRREMPAYAVFAEAQRLGRIYKISKGELSFLVFLLKRVEEQINTLQLDFRSAGVQELLGEFFEKKIRTFLKGDQSYFHKVELFIEGALKEEPIFFLRTKGGQKELFSSGEAERVEIDHLSDSLGWVQGGGSYEYIRFVLEMMKPSLDANRPVMIRVLDLFSGYGGKSLTWIDEFLQKYPGTKIHLTLVDHHLLKMEQAREKILKNFHEQVSLETLVWDLSRGWPPSLEDQKFHLIFVDAPCSALGTMAKHPEVLFRLNQQSVDQLALFQKTILRQAYEHLSFRETSWLGYSVCTFTHQETTFHQQELESFWKKRGVEREFWPIQGAQSDFIYGWVVQSDSSS